MHQCNTCDFYQKCDRPCNPVEAYVNRDFVPQHYKLLGDQVNFIIRQKWPCILSVPEVVISMFFKEYKKQCEIAKIIKKSRRYVSAIIKQYKPVYAQIKQKRAFLCL